MSENNIDFGALWDKAQDKYREDVTNGKTNPLAHNADAVIFSIFTGELLKAIQAEKKTAPAAGTVEAENRENIPIIKVSIDHMDITVKGVSPDD